MNTIIQDIKRPSTLKLQYALLVVFTLFSLYFCISSYRLYNMKTSDLNAVTGKVEQITFKKAKGKQAKPEVLINLSGYGKYRVAYGNNSLLTNLTSQIKTGESITVYLQKPQHVFLNFGMDNDILQIVKNGDMVYSLDIPQQNYHSHFLVSAILSLIMPLICLFFWDKSKKNTMLAAIQQSRIPHRQVSVS